MPKKLPWFLHCVTSSEMTSTHLLVLQRDLFDLLTRFKVSCKRLFDPLADLLLLLMGLRVSRQRSPLLPSRNSIRVRLILFMFGKTKRLTLGLQ
jgi:hypothetical protein